MSLQVWLPLNGNTNNYGVCNFTPTVVTAPTYVDGKLGKAMSTGAITIPAAAVNTFYNNKAMSFCFWIYALESTSTSAIIGQTAMAAGDNRMYTIFQYSSPNHLHLSWQGEAQNNAVFLGGQWSNVFPTNTWTHCAITYDGNTAKIYINGTYTASTTGTSPRTNFNYNVPIPNSSIRYLNDLRIYDEVLSEKQIKEISKALVCHYALDNNGSGMPNLAKGTNTASTGTNVFGYGEQTGGSSRTIEYDGGIPCAKITRNTTAHSGWAYLYYNNLDYNSIKTSTEYTVSFDAIGSGSGTISFSGFEMGNGTNNMSASTTVIQNAFNSTSWSHIVFKTTTKASFDDLTLSGQLVYMNTAYLQGTGTWLKMKNMKVEEGTVDTPWIPNSTDASYSIFNINGNKEIDISGYGNHGTKTNTTVTNDSVRYSVSTKFNGSNAFIACGRGGMVKDEITLNLWAYSDNWTNGTGTLASCTEGGGWSFGNDNGTMKCWIGTGTSSNTYVTANGPTMANIAAGWHMFSGTYNGLETKIYMDGVLKGTNTAYTTKTPMFYHGSNGIFIGAEAGANQTTPAGSYTVCAISDFRIYATALSADDITELYRASAEIDNSGNVYCSDFVEV